MLKLYVFCGVIICYHLQRPLNVTYINIYIELTWSYYKDHDKRNLLQENFLRRADNVFYKPTAKSRYFQRFLSGKQFSAK